MAGRKTKYKKQYCQELIEYFDKPAYREHEQVFVGKDGREWSKFEYIANDLPTIIGFCCKIGISKQTFYNWTDKHKPFFDAYTHIRDIQEAILIQNGLRGLYNSNFTTFIMKNNFGYKDKQDVELGGNVNIETVMYDEED